MKKVKEKLKVGKKGKAEQFILLLGENNPQFYSLLVVLVRVQVGSGVVCAPRHLMMKTQVYVSRRDAVKAVDVCHITHNGYKSSTSSFDGREGSDAC